MNFFREASSKGGLIIGFTMTKRYASIGRGTLKWPAISIEKVVG